MSWFDSLPTAEAAVPCGTGTHTVRWEAGQLALPAHPDTEAELVLGALGGDKPECVTIAETWARHADDLAVLTAGPRCAADRVSVDWAAVTALRADLSRSQALPGNVQRATLGRVGIGRLRYGSSGQLPGAGIGDILGRQVRRIELLALLALGAEFQFRLAGTVTAAWAAPERAAERASRRAEFAGVLTGRFALAAQDWAGIDPDAVTVTPHEGPGWGTIAVTGTGRGRRLRASLPLGWLASVWACGLALVDGHLVVAIERPGYPNARVLALAAPDSAPVSLEARATGSPAGGLMTWTL